MSQPGVDPSQAASEPWFHPNFEMLEMPPGGEAPAGHFGVGVPGMPAGPAMGSIGSASSGSLPTAHAPAGHAYSFPTNIGGRVSTSGQNPGAMFSGDAIGGQLPGSGPITISYSAAFGTGGFEGEPPLLEELGINFGRIKSKSLHVLNPSKQLSSLRGSAEVAADADEDGDDLAGPLLFCLLLGAFLLFSGKVHFSYIYGVAVVGCLGLCMLFNLMGTISVSVSKTASILGYGLLPMVGLSFITALVTLQGGVSLFLALLTVSWCTIAGSSLFVKAYGLREQLVLVFYPIFLFYASFALLTVL
ncbi:hypothetical protein H696_01844 [Fonticula alba]|uniref:Protein YIPF n=1 Tax=Fonticula alba TaxID=691883 RepID=A0A058ZBU3_FONAL|nr:hypothetical protein H696_01844 [Fonticula alba]KCV70897.1 hypothetical protein H696_01844 [Fonticula alba]|eukprot:XP_009494020.1 hypothetical protein H696_01844 [Fonticula alba]